MAQVTGVDKAAVIELAMRQASRMGTVDVRVVEDVVNSGHIPGGAKLLELDTVNGLQAAWLEGVDVVTRDINGLEVRRERDALLNRPGDLLAAFAATCAVSATRK